MPTRPIKRVLLWMRGQWRTQAFTQIGKLWIVGRSVVLLGTQHETVPYQGKRGQAVAHRALRELAAVKCQVEREDVAPDERGPELGRAPDLGKGGGGCDHLFCDAGQVRHFGTERAAWLQHLVVEHRAALIDQGNAQDIRIGVEAIGIHFQERQVGKR